MANASSCCRTARRLPSSSQNDRSALATGPASRPSSGASIRVTIWLNGLALSGQTFGGHWVAWTHPWEAMTTGISIYVYELMGTMWYGLDRRFFTMKVACLCVDLPENATSMDATALPLCVSTAWAGRSRTTTHCVDT